MSRLIRDAIITVNILLEFVPRNETTILCVVIQNQTSSLFLTSTNMQALFNHKCPDFLPYGAATYWTTTNGAAHSIHSS